MALALAFWCVREPSAIGIGAGFAFGLLMDVGLGAAMGQHALACVVLAYLANALAATLWFPGLAAGAARVAPAAAGAGDRAGAWWQGREFPGGRISCRASAARCQWTPLSFPLLLPQYQPDARDDNRPSEAGGR